MSGSAVGKARRVRGVSVLLRAMGVLVRRDRVAVMLTVMMSVVMSVAVTSPARAAEPGDASGATGLFTSLFYRASDGLGDTGVVNTAGAFTNLQSFGLSSGWTHIVPAGGNRFLYYRAGDGTAVTGVVSEGGGFTSLQNVGGFLPGWTNIVPVGGRLLFYRASDGTAATGVVNTAGAFTNLQSFGLSTGWTHVAPAGGNRLLFYRAGDGTAVTGALSEGGGFTSLQGVGGFLPGWTKIVPVDGRLLFYRAGDGTAATGVVNTAGAFTNLQSFGLSTGWTQVAPAGGNRLLFYRAGDGTAVTGALSEGGGFTSLQNVGGFLPGWTHIVDPFTGRTDIATTYQVPLAKNVDVLPPETETVVTSPTVVISHDLFLQAGETRRISDRLDTTINSSEGAEVDNWIECLDLATKERSNFGQASGTNHGGSGTGHVVLYGSVLFTAPHTGTYQCQLLAKTSDGKRHNYKMTANAGTFPNGTWLQISNTDEIGSHWWSNPACTSDGTSPTCTYLGATGDDVTAHIFQEDSHPYVWTAASDAVEAGVKATVQVTSCTRSTSSCTSAHKPTYPTFSKAVVQTHLEFVQLDAAGSFCRTNSTPDTRYTITNAVHHLVINYDLNPQISATCGGSRRFLLRVVMTHVSGNPVKIDSGSEPVDYHSSTNASAINRIRSTTATVPNVAGSSESSAVDAVQARGLAVGTVFRSVNPAPAGTVLAQNAPAGVVEPTGSPVNLFVSLGSATVPEVRDRSQESATSRITGAGLTVGTVSQVTNCAAPGYVQSQSPAGGTRVRPGSAVNITVATCTGTGGGGGNPVQPF